MTINEYQSKAMRTAFGLSDKDLVLSGVMGLNGEAGEAIDLVKKHLFQGHELSKDRLAHELGDVAWYIAVAAKGLGYDLETVLQMNIDKLKKRYPEGFEVEKSIHRKPGDE